MSQGEQEQSAAQASEAQDVSILDQAIGATKQTDRSRAKELLATLTEEALKGTVTWNKNVTATIKSGLAAIIALKTGKPLSASRQMF